MKLNKEMLKKDIKRNIPIIGVIILFIFIMNVVIGKICLLRIAFGIPCPGCGITRAFLLLFQGRFYEATIMHPFWIPLSLIVITFIFCRYFIISIGKYEKAMKVLKIIGILLMILAIIYYIYRMITVYPNQIPMVYDKDNIVEIIRKFFIK